MAAILCRESGFYYLQSRYYDPQIGRFINADSLLDVDLGDKLNLFEYCSNSPINKTDSKGTDGANIEIGRGWSYRIDPENTSTGTQRHIHIWKDGKSYAQNEDGSPHDKNNNQGGQLPNWVQKTVLQRSGWDYNGKRNSFYSNTQITYNDSGMKYSYPDNTVIFQKYSFFSRTATTVAAKESVYLGKITRAPSIMYIVGTAILKPGLALGLSVGLYSPIPLLF